MVIIPQHHRWTSVSLGVSVLLGLVNRWIPLTTVGYFDERPSLIRDLLYSRKLCGAPLPIGFMLALSLVGAACFFLGRTKPPLTRFLKLIGYLFIVGAWTPNFALVLALFFGFFILGWVIDGMGVEPKKPPSVWDIEYIPPQEYRTFWQNITHPSPRLHRTHLRWTFGICWSLALGFLAIYLFGGADGWLVRFPHTYSDPSPTIEYAVVMALVPLYLSALFELFRQPPGPSRTVGLDEAPTPVLTGS